MPFKVCHCYLFLITRTYKLLFLPEQPFGFLSFGLEPAPRAYRYKLNEKHKITHALNILTWKPDTAVTSYPIKMDAANSIKFTPSTTKAKK